MIPSRYHSFDEVKAATTKKNVEDLSVDAMAEKLDSWMLVLFEHLEECVANGISTEELFQILLPLAYLEISSSYWSTYKYRTCKP